MKENRQNIQYFLFSQYLADGIRIALEIILPAVIFSQFGRMDLGIIMSTGALAVSFTDGPGPIEHKRNGMLYCIICIFLVALVTGFVNNNIYLLGLLILITSFFFTMFTVFGNRAASLGTAALLIMVLNMDRIEPPMVAFTNSLLILSGGIWYMLIALLFFKITPLRPAQRLLGNCLHETAKYLNIKAEMYNVTKDISETYQKLVAQQVIVNEKQDELRELLYKNRQLIKDPSDTAKLLVITFADVIDLYEHITANWYDYTMLRQRFGDSNLLQEVSIIIKNLAAEMDRIGLAIQSNTAYKKQYELIPELEKLKTRIDNLQDKNNSNLVLKKILVNLIDLGKRVDELMNYFKANGHAKRNLLTDRDYSKFVSHQAINKKVFVNNFGLSSAVYRHSLRMMITCITGFIIAKLLPNAHHSYWILLTIIVILKPGFSLTRKRNFERLVGTIAGGLIGLLIIYFIHDRTALFLMIIFFMIGTYTFVRVNYILMVIFTTPYVLILLSLLGVGFVNVAEERLLDTAIGSALSFLASYLLFPHWESDQLESYMVNVIKANLNYLKQLVLFFSGVARSQLEYKLVRRDLYVSTANLSAAFQRMLSEPKNKQRSSKEIYEFVVLNHVLSSNIASLTASMINKQPGRYPKEVLLPIQKSVTILHQSLLQLDKNASKEEMTPPANLPAPELSAENQLLDQLGFIYKVAGDIGKITDKIAKEL